MTEKIKKIKKYFNDVKSYEEWKKTGILDGLSSEESTALIIKIEEMSKLLFNSLLNSNIDTWMIPIIVRAYKGYNYLVNNCAAAYQYVSQKRDVLQDLTATSYNAIDGEAEFCDLMASDIANLKL